MAGRRWNDEMLQAYLEYGRRRVEKSPGWEDFEWAFDAALEITDSNDADEVLSFVQALLHVTPDELVNWVAAGPLEDMLSFHGATVIDRVLRQAERDGRLRVALQGVWGVDRMHPSVGQKLEEARRRWKA